MSKIEDVKVSMVESIAGAIHDATRINEPLAETGRVMLEHVLNVLCDAWFPEPNPLHEAAPDMLEALEDVCGTYGPRRAAAIAKAHAAIAKAKGETE